MRAIALVDLDDTLFQTLRKCPPDVPQERLVPLGFARDGSPLSYATPRQIAMIEWLSGTAWLVPVTARSRDALMRAHIPFTAAIAAHGGVILCEDGAPDPDWHAHVSARAAADGSILHNLRDRIALEAEERRADLRVRVLDEEGVGLYVLAKHEETDENVLHATVDAVLDEVPAGWTVHRNGNNVAIMPPWLGKQHAVAALLPRLRAAHPDAPVIGIGDSLTDAPYMALCDYAMMPRGSQLARAALEPLL
ncbi:MAG: hypothetical protein ACK4SZ_10270 [Allosphingosinicella sp.]|uniref:hypothetical protein n=1 Tax=Allosphingosinicella sp. TaxID=2823234 RepID=UPI0039361CC7